MRKKRIILAGVAIFVVALAVYGLRVAWCHTLHDDACYVITLEIAARAESDGSVSDDDIRGIIADLIRASVIHGRIRPDGSPTDLKNNVFVVDCTATQISVSTRRTLGEPFGIKRVAAIKSHRESLQRGGDAGGR